MQYLLTFVNSRSEDNNEENCDYKAKSKSPKYKSSKSNAQDGKNSNNNVEDTKNASKDDKGNNYQNGNNDAKNKKKMLTKMTAMILTRIVILMQ